MVNKVAIIGQGYVGLPLAVAATSAGYKVVGIDNNKDKVTDLNNGLSGIEDLPNSELLASINSGNYLATSDVSAVSESEAVLICVPTPLDVTNKPDLTCLNSAVEEVSRYIKPNSLIIIESTVGPGTTRNVILPIIEKVSKLSRSQFHLAFSPERIDPTNKTWKVLNTPKLVSGLTDESSKMAVNFYSKFIKTIIKCNSLEIAETAKLLENSFRLINISFINEVAIICNKLGISVQEVIAAASTKPYGFMPFYPSIGVGGHCIPVDPIYFAEKARVSDVPATMIELASKINNEMPAYFVRRSEQKLGGLKGKRVLVVGVSYKPNVADVRETPVEALISGLKDKGAQVAWHDDLVQEWNGEISVTLSSDFDLAIIATPHDYLDLRKLGNVAILNTRESI
jgi:UDP-N-acetyl-D-glucosamine dehydrogenase